MKKKYCLSLCFLLLLVGCGASGSMSNFNNIQFQYLDKIVVDDGTEYTIYEIDDECNLGFSYDEIKSKEYFSTWTINFTYKESYIMTDLDFVNDINIINQFYDIVEKKVESINEKYSYNLEFLKESSTKNYELTFENPSKNEKLNIVNLYLLLPYRIEKKSSEQNRETIFINIPFYYTSLRQYGDLIEDYTNPGNFIDYSTFIRNL